jgi:peptidylprolyl isomerase
MTKLATTILALGLTLSLPLAARADEQAAAAPAKPPLPNLPAPPDVGKPPADAEKTASGLYSRVLQKGTGSEHPKAGDMVEVNYAGWMTDGKLFDTSQKRNATAKFPIDLLIKGWQEGLKLMVVGEKRRMWIPAQLAYGDTPRRPGGPFGMLVFDVELVSIPGPAEAAKVEKTPKRGKK